MSHKNRVRSAGELYSLYDIELLTKAERLKLLRENRPWSDFVNEKVDADVMQANA